MVHGLEHSCVSVPGPISRSATAVVGLVTDRIIKLFGPAACRLNLSTNNILTVRPSRMESSYITVAGIPGEAATCRNVWLPPLPADWRTTSVSVSRMMDRECSVCDAPTAHLFSLQLQFVVFCLCAEYGTDYC